MVIGNKRKNVKMIIYLDLCTHPIYVNVTDVRVRGSG